MSDELLIAVAQMMVNTCPQCGGAGQHIPMFYLACDGPKEVECDLCKPVRSQLAMYNNDHTPSPVNLDGL